MLDTMKAAIEGMLIAPDVPNCVYENIVMSRLAVNVRSSVWYED